MTKKILALFLILIIVGVAGCAVPTEKPGVSEDVAVGEDIDEITAIEEDLDTSSMDNLDQDLADITW